MVNSVATTQKSIVSETGWVQQRCTKSAHFFKQIKQNKTRLCSKVQCVAPEFILKRLKKKFTTKNVLCKSEKGK